MARCPRPALSLLVVLACLELAAQGSKADYERAGNVAALFASKVAKADLGVAWSPDETALLYRAPAQEGTGIARLDLALGDAKPAFDEAALAKSLVAEFGKTYTPAQLPVRGFAFGEDGRPCLLLADQGKVGVVRVQADGTCSAVDLAGPHPFGLEASPPNQGKASKTLGGEVHLLFRNQTDSKIQLQWLDWSGKAKSYGELAPDAVRSQHTFAGHAWLVTDAAGKGLAVFVAGAEDAIATVTGRVPEPPTVPQQPQPDPALSPDGRYWALIHAHNVVLQEVATGTETVLSSDGNEANRYGGFHWSPDSQHLVVVQTVPAQKHPVYLVESSPKNQTQPKLIEFDYLKPGDRVALRKPRLFDVPARRQIPVADTLFPTPWAITHLHWLPDSSRFLFLYNQRGHQVMRLLSVDAATGAVATVIDETSPTFIDYSNKTYLHYLDATGEAIWMSERDGWNHLYRIDLATGRVKNRVTEGQWVVRAVESLDEDRQELLLRVLGIVPGQDPYYEHFARVRLDGTGFTRLTAGDGTHSISWSPRGKYFVDTYSRVDLAPVRELRRGTDGALVRELSRDDLTALRQTGWQAPEPFVAKGRDGVTDIHGVIYRPTTFDAARKYPIIECIYAGPHGQFVPKSFAPFRNQQALAELGFVVVQIDGMGTNWRSRAFHDVCWRNLGDAGFPDRVAWLRAAAAAYPYLDLDRVGIYGGSAGGQNAMRALIAFPEIYSAAVADCGCHDNRMDKIWWNEAWMGWPIDQEAYERSSNVVQAHRMKGRLLLTVGELDRNVDPASTMQVVNALIKADKDFELIVFPGAGHGAGGSAYGQRRLRDFFVRHLYGLEPRHEG